MEKFRRKLIIQRIEERCVIEFTGYFHKGQPSPCHLWSGPTSGTGRGGGYGRMSLNSHTVAVHLVAYTHLSFFFWVHNPKFTPELGVFLLEELLWLLIFIVAVPDRPVNL